MIKSGMVWHLTVIENDVVLFGGHTPSEDEALECAKEARRRRPGARILIRYPMGPLVEYTPAGLVEAVSVRPTFVA